MYIKAVGSTYIHCVHLPASTFVVELRIEDLVSIIYQSHMLWCVKTRVCSMLSDPLSQLTAVFVPSGNDPPSTHCGWLCGGGGNISYHTMHIVLYC